MKFAPLLSCTAAMFLLAACDSEPACNDDIVGEKGKALTDRVTEMTETGEGNLGNFLVRLQEVGDMAAKDDVATNGVCEAMDALLIDMAK